MWIRVLSLLVLSVVRVAAQGVATYWQDGACTALALGGDAKLTWCIKTVVATASGRLELVASWTASNLSGGTLDKGSDTGNEKMYVVDNLGNRYDHIETRGAAADGGRLSADNPTLRGVFVFPPHAWARPHSRFVTRTRTSPSPVLLPRSTRVAIAR